MRDEDGDTLEDRVIARLEKRVLALERALKRFAAVAAEVDAAPAGPDAPDELGVRVRLGDCRAAAQLLRGAQ